MFIALLRGINVSGRKPVAMKDLGALFEALPADQVVTYLQSGNVVFRSEVADPDRLRAAIEARIRTEMGLDVVVLVRSGRELAQVVAGNPFRPEDREWSHLHVTFLATQPEPDRVDATTTAAEVAAPDVCTVGERLVYLYCPNGYGRTKLNNAFFEHKLGVAATTRNWRTVTKLAELAQEG